jgi:hypothetical protein
VVVEAVVEVVVVFMVEAVVEGLQYQRNIIQA